MVALTIKVRVFNGDSEQDVMCKFTETPLTPKKVVSYLYDKLQVPVEFRNEFALWIKGRDLELQLRPNMCLATFMADWHRWAEDAITLAGLQMQAISDYDGLKHGPGYLASSDRWMYLVPEPKRKALKPNKWVEKITESWKSLKGVTTEGAKNRYINDAVKLNQTRYINYVKKWPFYGNSMFPCCEILPPGGYFELRTQHWQFGVGLEGITIIDSDKRQLVLYEPWSTLLWEFGADNLKVWYSVKGKQKSLVLMTPQASIIENVVYRAVHLVEKSGQAINPLVPKMTNKGIVAAGKILSKVGDTGGGRFDDTRRRRAEKANSMAVAGGNVLHHAVIIDEE
ncbi:MAG: hypothetical protein SGCHY_000912 [Lobulomycetales sp.]